MDSYRLLEHSSRHNIDITLTRNSPTYSGRTSTFRALDFSSLDFKMTANSFSSVRSLHSRSHENDNQSCENTELIYDRGDNKSIDIVAKRKSCAGRKSLPYDRRVTGGGSNRRTAVTKRAQKQQFKNHFSDNHKRGTALLRSSEGTFRVHKIFGDGNCMFRAVSFILWGSEEKHRTLRVLVTRHIKNHWHEYEPFVAAEWNISDPEEYGNFMISEGVFATELECTVATKLYKMNLSIYREMNDRGYIKEVFHNRVNSSYEIARLLFSGRSESGHYDVLFIDQ